jgi:cytochrome b
VFKVHILAGLLACWFLFVRLVMGFVGSRPVRWTAFFKAISKWREYAAELRAWRAVERVGLNAGSALFALMIYVTVLGVVCTGFAADFVETWHGRLAYACVVLIGAHLAGLLAHAFRHREASPLAMIHGRVLGDAASALTSQRSGAGWLLIALGAGVASLLWVYFDEPTSVLRIPFLPEIYLPVIQKG